MKRHAYRKQLTVGVILVIVCLTQVGRCGQEDVRITPDVVYGHKHGMALTMDMYQPAKGNGVGVLFMVSGVLLLIIALFRRLIDEALLVQDAYPAPQSGQHDEVREERA